MFEGAAQAVLKAWADFRKQMEFVLLEKRTAALWSEKHVGLARAFEGKLLEYLLGAEHGVLRFPDCAWLTWQVFRSPLHRSSNWGAEMFIISPAARSEQLKDLKLGIGWTVKCLPCSLHTKSMICDRSSVSGILILFTFGFENKARPLSPNLAASQLCFNQCSSFWSILFY